MILNPLQAFVGVKTAIACIIFVMSHHIWDEGITNDVGYSAQGVFFFAKQMLAMDSES